MKLTIRCVFLIFVFCLKLSKVKVEMIFESNALNEKGLLTTVVETSIHCQCNYLFQAPYVVLFLVA